MRSLVPFVLISFDRANSVQLLENITLKMVPTFRTYFFLIITHFFPFFAATLCTPSLKSFCAALGVCVHQHWTPVTRAACSMQEDFLTVPVMETVITYLPPMTYQFMTKILQMHGLRLCTELLHTAICSILGLSLTFPASFSAPSFIKFAVAVDKTIFIPMESLPFAILPFHCHVRPYPGCRQP